MNRWIFTFLFCQLSFGLYSQNSCNNALIINDLPLVLSNASTCDQGNQISTDPCTFVILDTEEFLIEYNSPGDECVMIDLTGTALFSSTFVTVYDDCPDVATSCLVRATAEIFETRTQVRSLFLNQPGTYYIMVRNAIQCSDFNIKIERIDCPIIFPPASVCEEALPITGCDVSQPSIISVTQGAGDPDFLRVDINSGCWLGVQRTNYVWFYMEAQADGDFGFLLRSANSDETSDIDLQVWGPISDLSQQCDFAQVNEPIRSTWADEAPGYDLTGLVDVSPITNRAVTDDCEFETGDGFVRTIDVKEGEIYLILVNDYDGVIFTGQMEVDFSPTTPEVLGSPQENFAVTPDTVACGTNGIQLEATGGIRYKWLTPNGLSCVNCADPIATPNGDATYQVAIYGICSADTLTVNVTAPSVDLGDDFAVCKGVAPTLNSNFPSGNAVITWDDPDGYLSCDDCPDPTVNLPSQAGLYTFSVKVKIGDCEVSDDITIEVEDFVAPPDYIIDNAQICEGNSIQIGGAADPNFSYSWRDSNFSLISMEANPIVTPAVSSWYYLNLSSTQCNLLDSVFIEIVAPPVAQPLVDLEGCEGLIFELNPNGNFDLTYTWLDDSGMVVSTDVNPTITLDQTQTITVQIESGADCPIVEQEVELDVFPAANLSVSEDSIEICDGETEVLMATADVNGSFLWNTGETDEMISVTPSESVVYEVSFIDENNCDTLSESIFVGVGMAFSIDDLMMTPAIDSIFVGCEVQFEAEIAPAGIKDLNFEWMLNGDVVGTDSILVFEFETIGNQTLELKVNQNGGCEQIWISDFEVKELEYKIPNIFSPNGDGRNDFFKPISAKAVDIISMKLYNRWGQLIYDNYDNETGWDGNLGELNQPTDVYIYQITIGLPDGTEVIETGDVTLIR